MKTRPKIVFTNGCFDLIHPGHLDYLYRASELGDILVVGLNSDKSVRTIKGPLRPINSQNDRAIILAGLSFVSFVIFFDQPDPYNLILEVQPDVLVKGGDWPPDKIIGRDIVQKKGGQVLSIPLLEGYSSTSIIDRIFNRLSVVKSDLSGESDL